MDEHVDPRPERFEAERVEAEHPERRRLRRLAWLLDAQFRVPGTHVRFGVDALVGLVPGIGDVAGALVSGYIMLEALRMGASPSVLLRMGGNVALEVLVGTFPVLGDLFDVAFKANMRNVGLLERHLDDPETMRQSTARSNRRVAFIIVGVVLVLLVVALALSVALVVWLARWLSATFPPPA